MPDPSTFYATAAQVLPVLLLALLFESPWTADLADSTAARLEKTATVALLLFAELSAVVALIETPGRFSRGIVLLALGYGFVVLLSRPLGALLGAFSPVVVQLVLFAVLLGGFILALMGGEALPVVGFVLFGFLIVSAEVRRVIDARPKARKGATSQPEGRTEDVG